MARADRLTSTFHQHRTFVSAPTRTSSSARLQMSAVSLEPARMIDLAGYTFSENQASIVCTHVWDGSPVLLFAHDSDGDIQLLCGEHSHTPSDALVVGLAEISGHLLSMQTFRPLTPAIARSDRASVEAGRSEKQATERRLTPDS